MNDLISRQAVIDTEGLDAQIRCEMCKNPMHTDRGCDGNCKYDEKLYERIMQILGERIKPLPPAQPEQGDEAIFWKKRAREYEDIIADFVAEQAKGIKFDSITITEEGITFKKSQPEQTGKWIKEKSRGQLYQCSACNNYLDFRGVNAGRGSASYCPNCGCLMMEE